MIRFLTSADLGSLRALAATASAEGFGLLDRLVVKVESESVQLAGPREFFVCVLEGPEIVGVGGVTPDPYVTDPGVGRVRHVYVHPKWRRRGHGRALLRELVRLADRAYPKLRLRAETKEAGLLYEGLGFERISDSSATHARSQA